MAPHTGDEFRLTPGQLYHLKHFIARRGFGEPATLLEILDHFACKVEELWPEHPTWTLEEAMDTAHRSFGTAGFYPLAKAFHQATMRRFRNLFATAFWRVPRTLKGLLLLLCAGWGYYTLHQICAANQWLIFEEWNAATYLCYFAVLCVNAALFWERRSNPFLQYVNRASHPAIQVVVLLILIPHYKIPVPAGAVFFALAVWYLRAKAAVRSIALREQKGLMLQVYGA